MYNYTGRSTSSLKHRARLTLTKKTPDILESANIPSIPRHINTGTNYLPTSPKMTATQIASPLPIPPSRKDLRLMTGHDLFISLSATLSSSNNNDNNRPSTPVRIIREQDYSVPAPPPPSPVSFVADHWPASMRH